MFKDVAKSTAPLGGRVHSTRLLMQLTAAVGIAALQTDCSGPGGVQVQAGMWTRNGPEVAQLHHVYQSPYWSDTGLVLDLLALQLWLAHSSGNQ